MSKENFETPSSLTTGEVSTEDNRELITNAVNEFIDQEGFCLSALVEGRAGRIARVFALSTALAAASVGCSNKESVDSDSSLETVWGSEVTPEQYLAFELVGTLSTFRGSKHSKGLEMKMDELLQQYEDSCSLSREEVGINLAEALKKLADHGGDKDGLLDPTEEAWLEEIRKNNPGINILSRKFPEQFKIESGPVYGSGDIDTSSY